MALDGYVIFCHPYHSHHLQSLFAERSVNFNYWFVSVSGRKFKYQVFSAFYAWSAKFCWASTSSFYKSFEAQRSYIPNENIKLMYENIGIPSSWAEVGGPL